MRKTLDLVSRFAGGIILPVQLVEEVPPSGMGSCVVGNRDTGSQVKRAAIGTFVLTATSEHSSSSSQTGKTTQKFSVYVVSVSIRRTDCLMAINDSGDRQPFIPKAIFTPNQCSSARIRSVIVITGN